MDSSVLAFSLIEHAQKKDQIKAINFFHPSCGSSNETKYAEQTSRETGIPLLLADYGSILPLSQLCYTEALPSKPSTSLIEEKKKLYLLTLIQHSEKPLFLNGHGGDSLFISYPFKEILSDCFLEKGLLEWHRKLQELRKFSYQTKYFNTVCKNIGDILNYYLGIKRKKTPLYPPPVWLKREVLSRVSIKNFRHPLVQVDRRLLPGKFFHLFLIMKTLTDINDRSFSLPETVFPFLSQPMIELALSMPTYQSFNAGFDRYPVRRTCTTKYKGKSFWRKGKGDTSGVLQLGVKENLKEIREVCMEGYFARNQLIRSDVLGEHIQSISNGHMENLWPFLHLLCAERFISCWDDHA